MAAARNIQNHAPFAASPGQTLVTDATSGLPPVEVTITFHLVGTVAQIQADWAVLAAATITANSSSVGWQGGQI
jgi:hypothetical protein